MEFNEKEKTFLYDFGKMHKSFEGYAGEGERRGSSFAV